MQTPRPITLALLATSLTLGACQHSAALRTDDATIEHEIVTTLNRQAEAWNANDLDAWMAPYHRADDLRFAHPKGITLGWDTVREGYSRSITASSLEFSNLDVTVLAPDAAMVFGQFHNRTTEGEYRTGLFTLLMRRIDGQWKVVHDHSSDLPADTPPPSP